jgi:ABC-type transport system substrate-binding protein
MVGFVKMRGMKCQWLLVGAILLVGCGNNSGGGFSNRKAAGAANTLRYCLSNNPTTLDPAKVQDVDSMDVLNNIFEPLVNYDEQNKIVGVLASEWKVSEDGTTYTFKLKDAKFHDGSSVTTKDVKASWERALSKEVGSPIADTYLGDIVGAKELASGTASELSGVKLIDDHTFEVKIDKPRPYFLGKLTYPCCDIVPAKTGKKEISGVSDAVGTGPFVLSDLKPEQLVSLKRNENYYGDKATIDGIERKIVKDPSTRLTMYRNGETDMCTLEKQDWKSMQEDPKFKDQVQIIKRPAVFYLLLNGKAYAPFKDRSVRRAVMMAVNRQRIATEILKGVPVANRWLPEGILEGKPTHEVLAFDPIAAKQELGKSSFRSGDKMPPLEFTIRADNTDAKFIAEQVATDLKNNLGMTVKIRMLEWGALLKARNRSELDMAFLSWFGDYLDAQNFLSMLLMTNAPANYDKWSNPGFDKLCAAADIEKDANKREALYLEAEGLMLSEAARVPLYHGVDGVLVGPRVKGLRYTLIGSLPHNKVTLQ